MSKASLQFQLCIYPFLDGGFYVNGPHGGLNRCIRIGLGVVDFRIWWDDQRAMHGAAQSAVPQMHTIYQIPIGATTPEECFYFGAESGNTAWFAAQVVWTNEPTANDNLELEQFLRSVMEPK